MEEGEETDERRSKRGRRGSGREEQTAERESVGGKMLTLLLHLCERQIEGSKGREKKEGSKDQGNMGEGEGRSPSEGACVKVAVREGASLIPLPHTRQCLDCSNYCQLRTPRHCHFS